MGVWTGSQSRYSGFTAHIQANRYSDNPGRIQAGRLETNREVVHAILKSNSKSNSGVSWSYPTEVFHSQSLIKFDCI